MKVINFNKEEYPFDKLVSNLYEYDLNELNDHLDQAYRGIREDTDTIWHKMFYDKLREGWPEFVQLYKIFIKKELAPLFVEEELIVYQKTPSYRVSQPGGKAIYTPHCDGDEKHKHPSGEINFHMPLTKTYGNNSMFLESMPGLGDYKPVELEFGKVLMFYGNRQRHFNKFNDTGVTRCSFDFRLVPYVNYDSSYGPESATMNNKFVVGEYYEIMDK